MARDTNYQDVIWDPDGAEPESIKGRRGCCCGIFVLLLAVVIIVGAVAYWQGFLPGFIEELIPLGDRDNESSQAGAEGDRGIEPYQAGVDSDTDEGERGTYITLPATPATANTPAASRSASPAAKAAGTPVPERASKPASQTAATSGPAASPTATAAAPLPTPNPALRKKDTDGDGLIEVSNLDQLDAIRYDLDGDGEADSGSGAEAYAAAFPVSPGQAVCRQGCSGYELARSLDFDEAGSYASGSVSAAWTGGTGWRPIGVSKNRFNTTFNGNGHTISNLYIDRIRGSVGLFGFTGKSSVIRATGLESVEVYGGDDAGSLVAVNRGVVWASHATGGVTGVDHVGGLIGWSVGPGKVLVSGPVAQSEGTVRASYASVSVSGDSNVGGLVGRINNFATVVASYSTGAVSGRHGVGGLVGISVDGIIGSSYSTGAVSGGNSVGGLVGITNGTIIASYATGSVTGTGNVRGLGMSRPGAPISYSYWDTETSGSNTRSVQGSYEGKTTAELQSPTGYAGIYSNWNADVDDADGDGNLATGADNFWDFGTGSQYPALKVDFDGDGTATWQEFGKQHTPVPSVYESDAAANGKYDTDGDRLIEVSTLEQLDAIRYDLYGNGSRDYESDEAVYIAAFPMAESEAVCKKRCSGYELVRSLDFDRTDSYAAGAVNAAWVTGSGWLPIGQADSRYGNRNRFRTTFDGNGHIISNLYISRPTKRVDPGSTGLFGLADGTSVIRDIGLMNVEVTGVGDVGALVGKNYGAVSGAFVTGEVSGSRTVGGLVGRNDGSVSNSYATSSVSGSREVGGLAGYGGKVFASYATGKVSGEERVGGLVGSSGTIIASYATGRVSGKEFVGGLVGINSSRIIASYATGRVSGDEFVGGLVGSNVGRVVASYATGRVSGEAHVGGLIGQISSTPLRIADSYWDTRTSGLAIGIGYGDTAGVEGKTTTELQSPNGYTGIYRSWNADLDDADGDDDPATGVDDPWFFGTSNQYPVLKVDFDGDGIATWQEFGDQQTGASE